MSVYLFPGQGSQHSGMGKGLYEFQKVRDLFMQAEDLLGFPIIESLLHGDKKVLQKTKIAQPSIFLCSLALVKTLPSFRPTAVAGHSLGEITALAATGVLGFVESLRLIKARTEFMEEACLALPGAMSAVIGLEESLVEEVCQTVPDVYPANYNAPGQLVISGSELGIQRASQVLKKRGAKSVIPLAVQGSFHTPCMKLAQKKLEVMINALSFNQGCCPVYQNIDGRPSYQPEKIRRNLISQMTSPVLWCQTIQSMLKDGHTSFYALGPGKAMANLMRRIAPNHSCVALTC